MADNYTFKDAGGNTITHASKDVGSGVQATRHVDVDEANVAIAKAADAAHSSGDKGYMLLAVRKDTATALAGTDGDYIPLIVDASGRLHVADSAVGPLLGSVTETAPATDTASSGLNGRLQRIAQRLSSLIALLPASIGQKNGAGSVSVVLASDHAAITTGATDDAAVAGQIYPMAGLYQSVSTSGQVDLVDSGDAARIRASQRRALVMGPDRKFDEFYNLYVQPDTDMEVSTTYKYGTYSAPTTAFFDGADVGFGAAARYVRIPMMMYNACSVMVRNTLGVNLTVDLFATTATDANLANGSPSLGQIVVANNDTALITGYSVGSGAESGKILSVPAMNSPCMYLILKFVPASDPSAGMLQLGVNRSSV